MLSFANRRARSGALFLVSLFASSLVFPLLPTRWQAIATTGASEAPHNVAPKQPAEVSGVITLATGNAITVNSKSDLTNGGDGVCTLREAITAANTDTASGLTPGECGAGSGDDVITVTATGTINLTGVLPDISSNMTINGPGSNSLTVRRNTGGDYRIFTVSGATVSIAGLTVTNGKTADGAPGGTIGGTAAEGGGVRNAGTLTMSDVSVVENKSGNGGNASILPGDGGKGGGIYNAGNLTMTNCTVTGNNAGNGGSGGTGSGGGRGGDGGGIYAFSGFLIFSNVTISNNSGGGSTVANGFGGMGGGIFNNLPSSASFTNCTLSGNSSGNASGTSSTNGFGGGVHNEGAMTVVGTTISGNSSNGPGGGIINQGSMTLVNSTISGNSGASGGGVYDDQITAMSLTNCTITNNSASGSDGVITNSPGNFRVRNTIIAGNGAGADVSGTFTSQGNNLIGRSGGSNGFTNGTNGDQVGSPAAPLDPRLGALGNDGGPTQTHPLLADSSAIDAGNNCVVSDSCTPSIGLTLATDQRGLARSRDGDGNGILKVDIGAYEVQSIMVTNTADSGAGSLRQAITDANLNSGTDAINFQPGLTGTITLLTELPLLATSIKLNGPGANVMTVARSNVAATDFHIFTIYSGPPTNQNVWVTISGLTMTGGHDLFAGAIQNLGTLTINDSVITNNTSTGGGGGITNGFGSAFVSLMLNNCTVSNNSAVQSGGGIVNGAPLTIINSTISGNRSDLHGGGIMTGSEVLTIINSTIINNRADFNDDTFGAGGGMSQSGGGTRILRNTIVAGNFRGTGSVISDADLSLSPTSSFNLIGDGTGMTGISNGSNGNQVGTSGTPIDPKVSPLASNGGPTMTHLPLPGSPAINAGSNALLPLDTSDLDGDSNTTEVLPFDQRGPGFNRVVSTTVDIGAVEANYTIISTTGTPQSAVINTAFPTAFQATVKESGNNQSGIPVTFAAPGSGASGTFSGSATVNTNGSGVATAPTFIANGIAGGPYNVVGSLAGASPSANFALTNSKGDQAITFNALPNKTFGDPDFLLNATATSNLTVTFSASGACTVSGANAHLTGAGSCTITASQSGDGNYNAAPNVPQSFNVVDVVSINDVSITEGDSGMKTADFTVTLAAASNLTVTVNYATANGTATAGLDYQASSGGLSFTPGQTSKTISVTINGDQSFEPDETFFVNLSGATNGTFTDNQGMGTILNDDAKGGIITFSLDNYTVAEDGRTLAITVNRTGDTSAAATADYATSEDVANFVPCATINGIALSHCDFTSATGTLEFAPGETSKTFMILVSQDSYIEAAETFSVTLSNPTGGAVFGVFATATVTITDDSPESVTNPIDDAGIFVRQHYHDFLNRDSDNQGQDFWTGKITSCGNDAACIRQERIGVSAAFFIELEFQQTGFYVYRVFKAALGRRLSYEEFMKDRSRLQASPNLAAEQIAYALDFVQGAEFTGKYASATTGSIFVDALIQTVKDNSGVDLISKRNELITEYSAGTNQTDSRARTLRKLIDYDEFKAVEYNQAFVLAQYFGYLRRGPDTAGYNFWLDVLNSNPNNFRGMVCAFITSNEYQDRFGAGHTHTNAECSGSPIAAPEVR